MDYHPRRNRETSNQFILRAHRDLLNRVKRGESFERALRCTAVMWGVGIDELSSVK